MHVARAELIMGNSQPVNNDGQIYTFDSTTHYAIGITVGATPVVLSDLTLRLGAGNNPVIASIDLRSDPDTPGTPLASLNVSGAAIQNYLFNLSSVQLSAGATYWLNVGTNLTGNGDGLLLAANSPSLTPGGSALASYVGFRSGPVGNTSILLSPAFPDPTITMNGISVVPEPSSLGLGGLTLVAFVQRRRLRRMVRSH